MALDLGLGVYEETEVDGDYNEVGLEPLITSTTAVVEDEPEAVAGPPEEEFVGGDIVEPYPPQYDDGGGGFAAPPDDMTETAGKLFLGGISWQTDETHLHDYFSRYGDLVDVAVMRNKATGISRGFGFITYANPETVDTVLASDHVLDGRRVDIKRAVPRDRAPPPTGKTGAYGPPGGGIPPPQAGPGGGPGGGPVPGVGSGVGGGVVPGGGGGVVVPPVPPQQRRVDQVVEGHGGGPPVGYAGHAPVVPPQQQHQAPGAGQNRKLFVGGLAPSVQEADFRAYFERFGPVVDAVVMFDRNTLRSRGFGFVTFADVEAARQVLAANHELQGKYVEVKSAEPKEAMNSHGGGGGYHQQRHHHQVDRHGGHGGGHHPGGGQGGHQGQGGQGYSRGGGQGQGGQGGGGQGGGGQHYQQQQQHPGHHGGGGGGGGYAPGQGYAPNMQQHPHHVQYNDQYAMQPVYGAGYGEADPYHDQRGLQQGYAGRYDPYAMGYSGYAQQQQQRGPPQNGQNGQQTQNGTQQDSQDYRYDARDQDPYYQQRGGQQYYAQPQDQFYRGRDTRGAGGAGANGGGGNGYRPY